VRTGIQDTASGASSDRKGHADALDACACGDVLTVWELDRLGRTLFDLVDLVKDLKARGVGLKVLTGQGAAVDTTKAEGRTFFGMFAVLAEFERELIRERTKAGMKAAKRRGQHVGRPRKLTPQKLDVAARELAAGNSQRVVAGTLGVAVSTLRVAMKARAA
jgi:DNA invertase Pin-like site-specific DNA recombinase